MRKQHLHALSIVTRLLECLCFAERASDVTSVFMDVARDLAHRLFGTALHFVWTDIAIALACPVKQLVIVEHPACGRQNFSCRTNVNVALLVEHEIFA